MPQLLLNGYHVSMSINVVLRYFRIDARHIFIGPCKYLLKFCEKLFKIFSFFLI